MSRHGRRENDRLGAEILRSLIAEVRRRRPPDWQDIGFELRLRARVGAAGEVIITEPEVRSDRVLQERA